MTQLSRLTLAVTLTTALCGSITMWAIAQTAPPKPDKLATQPDKSLAGAAKPKDRDRWKIKTASDAEAQEIDRAPVKSTVEKLLVLPRPLDMPLDGSNPFFQEHRARPAETSVFSVEADVVDCRLMPDGDYRVTIRGASGKTVVLEMPNPAPEFVDPKSKFAGDIKAARGQFDAKFQPEKVSKPLAGHARITGVGYFARAYGNKKPDGNLIQLHPVLNIEWLDKPTTEFTAPQADPDKPTAKPPVTKPAPVKPPSNKPPVKKRK